MKDLPTKRCHFTVPPSYRSTESFPILHILPNTLFYTNCANGWGNGSWWFKFAFHCDICDIEHYFRFLTAICVSLLEKIYPNPLPGVLFFLWWHSFPPCGRSSYAGSEPFYSCSLIGPVLWVFFFFYKSFYDWLFRSSVSQRNPRICKKQ